MEDADAIYKAIDEKGGHFFVCGDVKMAHDVTSRLEQIVMEKGNMTAERAKQYIVKMRVYLHSLLVYLFFTLAVLLYFSEGTLDSSVSVLEEFICAVFSNVSDEIKKLVPYLLSGYVSLP